jgi:hypothetical protein
MRVRRSNIGARMASSVSHADNRKPISTSPTRTPILSGSFRRALATICCTRASSALRPRNAQAVTRDLRVALHACHERFVSRVDLLAQPLPNGFSDAFVDKAPISAACLFPPRTEREVM